MVIEYKTDDVLTAARHRMALIFDEFDRIVVSVSGGKDSTVLRHLAIEEAERRGRRVSLFFLDQEAEYQSTADLMATWMHDERIDPLWYQVPMRMTNATSHEQTFLHAWEPGATWLRPKDPIAITEPPPGCPSRFYDFFEWHERQSPCKTAYLVGLRSRESFNRFRAVTKSAGYRDWAWSTKTKTPQAFRVYPLFDWTFGDVWKYIDDEGLAYNAYYDRAFAKHGISMTRMRVSNLIHEQSFRCLVDLQEYEPETYARLLERLRGVHCAALYADEGQVFDAKRLPVRFATWREYRDYLLATTPLEQVARFHRRFADQREDEETCRQQVKQILINDFENNLPVRNPKQDRVRTLWWDRL